MIYTIAKGSQVKVILAKDASISRINELYEEFKDIIVNVEVTK